MMDQELKKNRISKQKMLRIFSILLNKGLLLVVLLMLNYIASRNYERFDLTKNKIHSLDERFKTTLEKVDTSLNIYVLTPDEINDPILDGVYKSELPVLMKNLENFSANIKVKWVFIDRDIAETKRLVSKYDIVERNSLIITYRDGHKVIKVVDMVEVEPVPSGQYQLRLKNFFGQDFINRAIISLIDNKKKTICLTLGHGETSLKDNSGDGMSNLGTLLKRESFEVKNLITVLDANKKCDVIALLGPEKPFEEFEIKRILQAFENGTNLLVLTDPLVSQDLKGFDDLKLESFFKYFGLKESKCIAIDPDSPIPLEGAETLYLTKYLSHPITNFLTSFPTYFQMAQAIVELDDDKGFEVEELIETGEASWCESDIADPENIQSDDSDLKGPLAIGMSVKKGDQKAVFFGNSFFATNHLIEKGSNYNMIVNSLRWLSGDQVENNIISKPFKGKALVFSETQFQGVHLLSSYILPACFLIASLFVYLKRRSKRKK